ncbi:MAG TPA: hypothetical protein VHC49_19220 [Mycobacteriales bacterium]|nr:hypothetical protein [Mycobacteriales bacterium]
MSTSESSEDSGGVFGTCLVTTLLLLSPIVCIVLWLTPVPNWVRIPVTVIAGITVAFLIWGLWPDKDAEPDEEKALPGVREFAAQHGFTYAETLPDPAEQWGWTVGSAISDLEAFRAISGTLHDLPVTIFRFRSHRLHNVEGLAVAITLPHALPYLSVAIPTTTGDVAPGTHGQRIQFEDRQFNERYTVRSFDHSPEAARYAYAIVNPRAIELMNSRERFYWDLQGSSMILQDLNKRWTADNPADYLALATVMAQIVQTFPAFVWSEFAAKA